jgi:hypothetical protein
MLYLLLGPNEVLKASLNIASQSEFGVADDDDVDMIVDQMAQDGLLPEANILSIYNSLNSEKSANSDEIDVEKVASSITPEKTSDNELAERLEQIQESRRVCAIGQEKNSKKNVEC